MLVKEFSGKTERDALQKALEELNLTEDKIRVEVLEKGKRNILGIGESIESVIRVYYEEITTLVSDLQKTVETMLSVMGIKARVEAEEESEKRIYINIISEEDAAILIGKKGATLDAVQFIISLIASKQLGEDNEYHILVDIEGYRQKREKSLKKLASQAAMQVKRTQKPKTLDPMNPYERRIIHLTLQDDNEVETKSDGEGPYRKVKIYPRRNNSSRGYRNSGGYNNRRSYEN